MKKHVLFLSFCLLASQLSFAATKTWTGNASTDRGASGNWSPAGRPLVTDDVIIPANAQRYPIVDLAVSNGGKYTSTDVVNEPDYCVLQFPTTISVTSEATSPIIYGRIFEAGLTTSEGASSQVTAQVGYGPINSDPRTSPAWIFTNASFNMQIGNDDEYQATFTAPCAEGSYSYVYRFSLDGGANWTYADRY